MTNAWIYDKDQNGIFCGNCKYGFGTGYKVMLKKFKFCPYCGKDIVDNLDDLDGKGVAWKSPDEWITDSFPEDHDMYLVTWTSSTTGKYKWLELLEFIPEDENGNEGEGWTLYDLEKKGFKDIKVIAWKPVKPYDPEGVV